MAETAVIKVVVRRGALSAWVSANPVLLHGEFGLVSGGGAGAAPILIVGNGIDDFNTLWASDLQKIVSLGSIVLNQITPLGVSLQNEIATEATQRTNADTNLQNQITYISGTQIPAITTDLDAVTDGLVQELIDRADADAYLQAQFDAAFEEFKANQGNLHSHWFSGEAIPEATPVMLGEDLLIYVYDPTNPAHVGRLIGLTAETADSAGIEIKVYKAGLAVYQNTVFGSAGVKWIDPADGSITDTEPTTSPKTRLGYSPFGTFIILRIEEVNDWHEITGKPTEFTPEAHVHTLADIVDAGDAAGKDTGTTAGTVAAGDDARFSDRRGGNYYRRSGRWYLPTDNATALTATNHSTPSVFFVPMVVGKTITIDAIAVEVTSAGSAGSIAHFGIYNGNATTCEPTTLICDSGAGGVSVASTGVKTVVLASPITLQPGLYFTALSTGSATPHQFRSLSTNSFATVIGQAAAGTANQGTYINGTRAAFGTLPANASSLTTLSATAGTIYGLWFRIQ